MKESFQESGILSPSEPSLVAIYDLSYRNDIIAGLQAVILEKDLNSSAVEDFGMGTPERDRLSFEKGRALTIYIKDLWLKKASMFLQDVMAKYRFLEISPCISP